ncbi:MAG: hypothetical protein IJV41_11630 [Oscillospiraceae bacterium]|nr:hypothetical protein [Oscillospiraceae bacterium]
MKIYLDSDYRCHLTDDGTRRAIETDVFDGKCRAFIEGFRFVPDGERWTRSDGVVFHGTMIAPAEDYSALARAQAQFEEDEAAHLEELAALIEEIYNEDMEVINNV